MNYLEYEDAADYGAEVMNDELILLLGYNREAKCREYHWAAKDAGTLADRLNCKTPFFLTFVPREWVKTLESAGLKVRNAWHDYFLKSLDTVDVSACADTRFLTAQECDEASAVTQA